MHFDVKEGVDPLPEESTLKYVLYFYQVIIISLKEVFVLITELVGVTDGGSPYYSAFLTY